MSVVSIPPSVRKMSASSCGRRGSAVTARDCTIRRHGGHTARVLAHEIPIAHTPPGGYGTEFPPPVLDRCTEPLVAGAPDLRGVWRVAAVEVAGVPASDHPAL